MLICKHFGTFLAIYLHTVTGTKCVTLGMGFDTKGLFICKELFYKSEACPCKIVTHIMIGTKCGTLDIGTLYKSDAGPCNIYAHYDCHQMWYIG